jgi:hypothetical protein
MEGNIRTEQKFDHAFDFQLFEILCINIGSEAAGFENWEDFFFMGKSEAPGVVKLSF